MQAIVRVKQFGPDREQTMQSKPFRVGLSADFLDENHQLAFPDIGLGLLDAEAGIEHYFLSEYRTEYEPHQLQGIDVLISLKPRLTQGALAGVDPPRVVRRRGAGYRNCYH